MSRRVYVDSCVLIHALRGEDEASAQLAISEISQTDVEYVFSPLSELEVLPQPLKHCKEQAAFFEEWFKTAQCEWYSYEVHRRAIDQASRYSIAALDAAHVATAIVSGADELITAEKLTKPMYQSKEMRVRNIFEK